MTYAFNPLAQRDFPVITSEMKASGGGVTWFTFRRAEPPYAPWQKSIQVNNNKIRGVAHVARQIAE
jgi:hypothetical protein